jgi:hypothetical protein
MRNFGILAGVLCVGVGVGYLGPKLMSTVSDMAQPDGGDIVSRAGGASIGDLALIATDNPLGRTKALTDEQLEFIAFFERTARELNEGGSQHVGDDLIFDHLAIDALNVKYYYTIDRPFERINPRVLLDEQRELVERTLCADDTLKLLITEYGFNYSYSYLSQDSRLVGRYNANIGHCEG